MSAAGERTPRGTGETGAEPQPYRERQTAPQAPAARPPEVEAPASDETFLQWSGAVLSRFGNWARTPRGAAIIAIMAVAILLRTWDLGSRALHHDESLHAYYSWVLADTGRFQHNPLMHGSFQFVGMALVQRILGDSDATVRLLAAITGIAVVALPLLLLREQLGRWGAVIASLLLAVSPAMVYFSRFAREDTYFLLWTFLFAACLWRYIQDPKPRFLYGGAAGLALAFATKEAAYLLTLVFILFLVLYLLPDMRGLVKNRFRARTPAATFLVFVVTLILPLGAAGAALFQDQLGLHLANPDPCTVAADPCVPLEDEDAIRHLPGPVGAPISQGPGIASGIFDRVRGLTGLQLASPDALQNPEAGALRIGGVTLQALDVATIVTLGLFVVGAVIGLWWDRRRWLVSAAIFWGLFIFLFTTPFMGWMKVEANWLGLGSGVWQSLGYWVAQQDVARGGQPWYYYPMLLATYEFLPLVAGAIGGAYLVARRDPIGTFLASWLLMALVAFTYAAEKMPWLSIHLALPLILLAARGLGLFLETTWQGRRLLLPPRERLLRWGGVGAAGVLLLVTAQVAVRASFRYGDVPVEMLVYTQTSPAVARTVDEIERFGRETGLGRDFPATIDLMDGFGWPYYWYLRDYKRIEYRCLGDPGSCGAGADPLSRRPAQGSLVVAHVANDGAVAPYLSQTHQPGVTIPFRQWFPEEAYRGPDYAKGLNPFQVLRGAFHPGTWATIWRYWSVRELPRPLGHVDVVVYYQQGLQPAPLTLAPADTQPALEGGA